MNLEERVHRTFRIEEWIGVWAGFLIALFGILFAIWYFVSIGGVVLVLVGVSMRLRGLPIIEDNSEKA